jgi:hypothetical protein
MRLTEARAKLDAASSAHVMPPSVDFKMPTPAGQNPVRQASPVPMQMIRGSLGANATVPVARAGVESVIGDHEVPASRLSHTPQFPTPISQWLTSVGSTAIAATRPELNEAGSDGADSDVAAALAFPLHWGLLAQRRSSRLTRFQAFANGCVERVHRVAHARKPARSLGRKA